MSCTRTIGSRSDSERLRIDGSIISPMTRAPSLVLLAACSLLVAGAVTLRAQRAVLRAAIEVDQLPYAAACRPPDTCGGAGPDSPY
jgi:hypothetical protein